MSDFGVSRARLLSASEESFSMTRGIESPRPRRRHVRAALSWALVVVVSSIVSAALTPGRAHAYTTRVHIAMANEVRAALVESGDGTIRLRWSDSVVTLPRHDADAIVAILEPHDESRARSERARSASTTWSSRG